tara:strand:+ start:2768 stop:3433 length:666 start_codon:yes stop_codon:yes gene_type:complete
MIKAALNSKQFLILEFILLCIAVPGYIIWTLSAAYMFGFLWGAALYCFVIYRYCMFPKGGWKEIWNWSAVNKETMKPLLMKWVLASLGMIVFIYFYDPDRMFYIVYNRPEMIPFLLVAYPLISALPQEFIFCSFFFNRYEKFFGRAAKMIWASAIIFAYAHILYINPVAPTLSLVGGLIFAHNYAKHRSLALVSIEHGLYGNVLFIIGLGWYFYSGSVATG